MARTVDHRTWEKFFLKRKIHRKLATAWAQLARPNIQLIPGPLSANDDAPCGASKLGGLPDLRAGMPWPIRAPYAYPKETHSHVPECGWEPQPLAFLAQISLADVAKAGTDLPLPNSGLLSFFYDAHTQPWGFDPADAPGARVIYTPAGTPLIKADPPSGHTFKSRALWFSPGECLPRSEWVREHIADKVGLTSDRFDEEDLKLDGDEDVMSHEGHSFGGWPFEVQAPMQLECQLASNGIYVGNAEGYADARAKELENGEAYWRLLLQLDSDEEMGWEWGDVGKLYFWCREQDIATREFERCWTILQCG